MKKLLILMLLVTPAFAHDVPESERWITDLSSIGGGKCCYGDDSVVLNDVEWEHVGEHYRVKLRGDWHVVPPDRVISPRLNRDGRARVWPLENTPSMIRCFMPGTES
jgi:hypothetical protein